MAKSAFDTSQGKRVDSALLERLRSEVEDALERGPRTEIRATRLNPEEAEELDRRAALVGVDVATYLRIIALTDLIIPAHSLKALDEVYDLVVRFEEACQNEAPTLEEVKALREAIGSICRHQDKKSDA